MAKVRVEDGCVDIQVSLLERVMLAERSRRVPLSSIRAVNPHPPLLDMKMHWAGQGGVWLCGVSAYDGHLIPSARNPAHTLAIEVADSDDRYLFVELDDEAPENVAERIEHALSGGRSSLSQRPSTMRPPAPLFAQNTQEPSSARGRGAWEDDEEDWEDEEDVRLRDPLMQGSLPPPPSPSSSHQSVKPLRLDSDRDLARLGGWLVALGSFCVLTGTTIVAAGLLPGLIAVGAGIACGVIGGLALALVAHHQG
jgi:hypothetical protein